MNLSLIHNKFTQKSSLGENRLVFQEKEPKGLDEGLGEAASAFGGLITVATEIIADLANGTRAGISSAREWVKKRNRPDKPRTELEEYTAADEYNVPSVFNEKYDQELLAHFTEAANMEQYRAILAMRLKDEEEFYKYALSDYKTVETEIKRRERMHYENRSDIVKKQKTIDGLELALKDELEDQDPDLTEDEEDGYVQELRLQLRKAKSEMAILKGGSEMEVMMTKHIMVPTYFIRGTKNTIARYTHDPSGELERVDLRDRKKFLERYLFIYKDRLENIYGKERDAVLFRKMEAQEKSVAYLKEQGEEEMAEDGLKELSKFSADVDKNIYEYKPAKFETPPKTL